MLEEKNILLRITTLPVVQGTVTALAIGLLGTFLLSLVFYATSLSEVYLQPSGNVLYLVGAFSGGFVGAKRAGRKGMQFGVGTGLCYFLLFVIILLFFAPSAFSWLTIGLRGLYALIVAAVGGIFGIAFAE